MIHFSPARAWLNRFAGKNSAMAQRLKSRSTTVEIIEWREGEDYLVFRERVRQIVADRHKALREPGADDDLVPAEADQA